MLNSYGDKFTMDKISVGTFSNGLMLIPILLLLLLLFCSSIFVWHSFFGYVLCWFWYWSMLPYITCGRPFFFFFLVSKKRILLKKEKQEKHKELTVVNNGKRNNNTKQPLIYSNRRNKIRKGRTI